MRHRTIGTTEKYLHADVDRLGAVLVRASPLEGWGKKKAAAVRPAVQMILGELGEVEVASESGGVEEVEQFLANCALIGI